MSLYTFTEKLKELGFTTNEIFASIIQATESTQEVLGDSITSGEISFEKALRNGYQVTYDGIIDDIADNEQ